MELGSALVNTIADAYPFDGSQLLTGGDVVALDEIGTAVDADAVVCCARVAGTAAAAGSGAFAFFADLAFFAVDAVAGFWRRGKVNG